MLIPYLVAWNLFFVIFIILYIIYWCGVAVLGNFLSSKYVNFSGIILLLLYIGYASWIQSKILYSNAWDLPDFSIDNETMTAEKENIEKDINKD